jgi:hypothetical protein
MIVEHLPNQNIFGIALAVKLPLRLIFTLPGRLVWFCWNTGTPSCCPVVDGGIFTL